MSIVLTYVHLDRLGNLSRNILYHKDYVDKIVVCDGGSTDGTLDWISKLKSDGTNIEVVVHKQYHYQYGEHAPDARNPYLRYLNPGDWMLCLDDDEYLEKEACRKLRYFAERAEQAGFDEIRFQARDIWTYETGEQSDSLADYWKQDMFVKVVPGMEYKGHTHAGLRRPGAIGKWAKAQGDGNRFLHYRHEKTERMMFRNSTFLYWASCRPAQNRTDDPKWLMFHEMMKRNGFFDWHDFHKTMESGNISDEIKEWMILNKEAENPEEAAYFIYYFVFLHPEENINKISCDRHNRYTWDYVLKTRKD